MIDQLISGGEKNDYSYKKNINLDSLRKQQKDKMSSGVKQTSKANP